MPRTTTLRACTLLAALALAAPLATARAELDEAGEALLARVRAAYVDAPALDDDYRIVQGAILPGRKLEPQPRTARCRIQGDDFDDYNGFTRVRHTRLGEHLYRERDDSPERALRVPHEGDHHATWRGLIRGGGKDLTLEPFAPQLLLRHGRPWSEVADRLALGFARGWELQSVDALSDGPAERARIRFVGERGSLDVVVDARSGLMLSSDVRYVPDGLLVGDRRLSIQHVFFPRVLDALDEPIALAPGLVVDDARVVLRADPGLMEASPPSLAIGSPAPDFELTDQDGASHKLSDHRGQVVVLDFWGSWCPPCVRGLGYAQTMHERLAERGLVLLALNVRDDNAAVERLWAKGGYGFPTLHDAEDVAWAYGVDRYPTTVVIDAEGDVVSIERVSAGAARKQVQALLDDLER